MRSALLLVGLSACALPPPGTPTGIDDDGDGSPAHEDCDDTDPALFPGAQWEIDADGDGYTSGTVESCAPPEDALVGDALGTDCDDDDEAATVVLQGFEDLDGDGFGGSPADYCGALPAGWSTAQDDCDEVNPRAYLGAPEDCGLADLDCVPDNDPDCRIAGTVVIQLSGDEWYPEVGVQGPDLDGDPRADVLLLGDYAVIGDQVLARRYDLDDAGNASAPLEYTYTPTGYFGHSLEFLAFPDLDGDTVPEIWLVHGDFNDPTTHIWDLADVAPGVLDPADAFVVRSPPQDPFFTTLAGASTHGDLHPDAGLEVALRAFNYSDEGRVEIWGGFLDDSPGPVALVTGPSLGGYFGADVYAADLDGDGMHDLAVTRSSDDQSSESIYVFHGPFPVDRNAADADAALQVGGGMLFNLGQVEPAGDLLGDGRSWLYWGSPEATFGGRVHAFPGDLETAGPTDPLAIESRGITGTADWPGFGGAMGSVGDQTGDGVADVLVGAPHWDGFSENAAFLLDSNTMAFGSGLSVNTPGAVAARIESPLLFGYVTASPGDVDGDGWQDVWIGLDGPAVLLYGGLLP